MRIVYLPTLYGEGDPHHAKALPSFMLCAAGRGESRMVVYGDGVARRQFMNVDAAAARLVLESIRESEPWAVAGEEWAVAGEEWAILALANEFTVAAIAAGRSLDVPELRPWQFRADGLGSPSPERIGPERPLDVVESELRRWIDTTVKRKNDELRAEKDQERTKEEMYLKLARAAWPPPGSSEDSSS